MNLSHRTLHWNVTSAFLLSHSLVPPSLSPRRPEVPRTGERLRYDRESWRPGPDRREPSPGTKSTGESRRFRLAANKGERFFERQLLRGWLCFGRQEMNDQYQTKHHLSHYHQPRVRRKYIKSALTSESLAAKRGGEEVWAVSHTSAPKPQRLNKVELPETGRSGITVSPEHALTSSISFWEEHAQLKHFK